MSTGHIALGAGVALQALFALAHLGGVAATVRSARSDDRLRGVFEAMRAYTFRLGGVESSLWSLRQYFGIAFSVLLLWCGAATLVVWHGLGGASSLLARMAMIDAVGMLGVLALSVYFRVVQGAIASAVIAVCYALAWWLLPR